MLLKKSVCRAFRVMVRYGVAVDNAVDNDNDIDNCPSPYCSAYCFMRKALKLSKSLVISTLCFVPFMKAARRSGICTSVPMASSTTFLNLAGWAVSPNTPCSPGSNRSFSA